MRPSKIVCVGRNYADHAKEMGNDVPSEPLIFLKPPSSLVASGDAIVLPPESKEVHFEGEIAVILGARLTRATEANAREAIAGLAAANDVTARDLQRRDSQWARAKGFDTFCPIGSISSGAADLGGLELTTRVNGAVRQRASSRDMIFPITRLLSYISGIMTLEPGDIVLTGPPAGVGELIAGDQVEVAISGVSRVSNPVTASQVQGDSTFG
ncbi:MAG: fumarylacetoacetate hydrolase family protein [Gemmatimonadaceae bacterium]